MKALLSCLFAMAFYNGLAQSSPTDPSIIPPSPNAYSLGKYGDVPVSLYTGVPDINVPIWTLHENKLSVDVSLSYHGSGIKVDEVASWVGLGWSLNAGGIITRTVRGRAEYLLSDGTFMPERADISFYNGSSDYNERNVFIQQNKLEAAANGGLDTEPDEYYFNFQGRSGKFSFDKEGNALLYKHEGLDIKLEYASGFKFDIIITAEDGTVYEFADYEETFFTGMSQMHITAWHLSKIKSPSGSEIIFEYQSIGSISHNIRGSSDYVVELTFNPSIFPPIAPHTGMSVSELRINKITTDNGWIEFKTNLEGRLDYKSTSSSHPLDTIIVHRSDGSILRKFKLHTSYFEANDYEKYDGLDPSAYQHLNYRLRLDAIQELSGNDVSAKPPYKFVYWGDDDPLTDDVYTLPYRLSPKQDHWGYFNDSSNEHIFPGNSDGRQITSDPWYKESMECAEDPVHNSIGNGANREPNAEAVKAGVLKEVHYPTGGHSEFVFEPNEWSASDIGGGLRVGKIIDHTGAGEAKETSYNYNYRVMVSDPRDNYYKFYCILNAPDGSTNPDAEVMSLYGLTSSGSSPTSKFIKISTYPQALLGSSALPGYGGVTVYQTGNGYTISSFDDHSIFPDYAGMDDIYDDIDMFHTDNLFYSQYITSLSTPGITYNVQIKTSVNDFPYPELYNNNWKRGVLRYRGTYNKDSVLLKRETYNYDRKLLGVIPGFKIVGWGESQQFIYSKYYVPHAWAQLKRSSVEQYDQNGDNPVRTITEYYYDNLSHA